MSRILPPIKALLFFVALLIPIGCGQEQGEASSTPAQGAPATSSAVLAITAGEPTASQVAVETEEFPPPATPTAEPTAAIETNVTAEPTVASGPAPSGPAPSGALIEVSMDSQVGILLDEIPVYARDKIVNDILERGEDYWLELARKQIRLTRNRLNFRNFNYPDKGQLPLPPEVLWSINLDPAGPDRQTIQGHDLVMIGYTFNSTLLTDADSPGQAEPALTNEGGVWQEPFVFPVDPDLLLQRTGNACINEGGFPPNSFDSENIRFFYDHTCEADSAGAAGCHRTRLPRLSCREALTESVGEVAANLRFERIAWDSEVADAARVGPAVNATSPDLMVVGEDLDTNRIVYRYIEPEDCALGEGAVGGSGWRRLLQFSATVGNVGAEPLVVGSVVAEDPVNHVFSYSSCHDHFHYSNYGDFSLGDSGQTQSSKQAFCVQSTSRLSNNESSPLTHDYSCQFQGIQAGWVDEYVAGLDTQWVDITDMNIPSEGLSLDLAFTSNRDQFLCEGTAVLDENGEAIWEPSGFYTDDGDSVNRPKCDFTADWNSNNRASREVFIPQIGSFVSESCANGEFSPLRNCGFEEFLVDDLSCVPGETVQHSFRLEDEADLQVIRVCQRSNALGSGLACAYEESVANVVIGSEPTTVSFVCPQIRDAEQSEGGYALYSAPVSPADAGQALVPVDTGAN